MPAKGRGADRDSHAVRIAELRILRGLPRHAEAQSWRVVVARLNDPAAQRGDRFCASAADELEEEPERTRMPFLRHEGNAPPPFRRRVQARVPDRLRVVLALLLCVCCVV